MRVLSSRFVGVNTNPARTLELRTEYIKESSDVLFGERLNFDNHRLLYAFSPKMN